MSSSLNTVQVTLLPIVASSIAKPGVFDCPEHRLCVSVKVEIEMKEVPLTQ